MAEETNSISVVVDRSMLACTVKSGALEVLATPMLIALMEQAASELLQTVLAPGETSVGTAISIEHTAATPLGMRVTAHARLIGREGRRATFELSAEDDAGPIGNGSHSRFVVLSEKFQAKAHARGEK